MLVTPSYLEHGKSEANSEVLFRLFVQTGGKTDQTALKLHADFSICLCCQDHLQFYTLSTVLQSYQDDRSSIMKGCVQQNPD